MNGMISPAALPLPASKEQHETMFPKEDASDTDSPSCIMVELQNASEIFRGLPVVPNMEVGNSSLSTEAVPPRPCLATEEASHSKQAKSVSFRLIPSGDGGDVNVTHCRSVDQMLQDNEVWYSKAQIHGFYKQATRQAKCYSTRNRKEGLTSLGSVLQRLYEEAEAASQLSDILNGKTASELLEEVGAQESRGLESFLNPCIKRRRVTHVHGVLTIQNALHANTLDQDTVTQVLRTRSLQTSRASRVLSRLLAHGDYLQLTQILREELQQQDAGQSRSTPCRTLGSSILSS